jgi:hypothetical protein
MNAWAGTDRASGHFCCHALRAIYEDISFSQNEHNRTFHYTLTTNVPLFFTPSSLFVLFVFIAPVDARSPGPPAMTWSEQDVRASPYHRRSLRSRLHAYLARWETWTPSLPAPQRSRVSTSGPISLAGSPHAAHTLTGPRRLRGPHYNCSIRTAEAYGEATGRVRERTRVSMGRQESER